MPAGSATQAKHSGGVGAPPGANRSPCWEPADRPAASSRNVARRFGPGDATLTPATESEARRRNENTANGMRDGCVAKADSFDALPASGLLECIFDALPLRCLSACMARREAPAAISKRIADATRLRFSARHPLRGLIPREMKSRREISACAFRSPLLPSPKRSRVETSGSSAGRFGFAQAGVGEHDFARSEVGEGSAARSVKKTPHPFRHATRIGAARERRREIAAESPLPGGAKRS